MSLNLKVDRSRRGFARRRRRGGGGGGGWIALLILLAALVGSGYLLLQMRLGRGINLIGAGTPTTLAQITVTPTRSFDDFVRQAELSERDGVYRKAIELYDQASRRKPNDPDLHARIARLQVFLDEPAKAEQRARKALTIDVNHAPSRAVLCMAIEWQSRLDEALAECEVAVAADPKLAIAHAYLSETHADRKNQQAALKSAQAALDIDPKNTDALRNMGYAYFVFGQYETALSWYQRALDVNPNLPVVLIDIAKIRNFWAQSSADAGTVKLHGTAAVNALTTTLTLDDKNTKALEELGEAYRLLGDFDVSVLTFDKAVKLDPKRISTYTSRAVLRFQRADYLNAISDYETAISLGSEIGKQLSEYDYLFFGYAQQLAKRCDAARETMLEAQRLYPDNGSLAASAREIDKRCGVR